jgi:regulator of RNase E activity RraA
MSWSASPTITRSRDGRAWRRRRRARCVSYVVAVLRDTELVLEQGFPVFCSFLTPSDVVRRWMPDAYGAPVDIGGVTIRTGDWLIGDRDGIVIVPGELVEEVVAKTEEVVATESDMRRALVGGMDPVALYHKYGKP